MSKIIFITIYDGDTEKNILRSGVLEKVLGAGHRVILLVRGAERLDYYQKEFGRERVTIELLPKASSESERIWFHLGWNTLPTRTSYTKRHDLFLMHKNRWRYCLEMLAWYMGHLRLWRELLRFVYYHMPDDYAANLFERYKPDMLFAPNMFSPED